METNETPLRLNKDRAGLLLLNELTRRVGRNPRYSARAFAKSLGISHTLLSLILSRKRRVSKKLLKRVINTLSISAEEVRNLQAQNHANPFLTEDAGDVEYKQISLDTFNLLSDWQHYAILSLLELPHARLDPRWIARRLGISPLDARLAVERLKRLKFIDLVDGKWKQCTPPLKVENTEASVAAIRHHKQLLKKAEEALENADFKERDFSAMTFALDPKLIPIARKKIAAFRRRLVNELEMYGAPTEVYQLTVQIYPITKEEKIS